MEAENEFRKFYLIGDYKKVVKKWHEQKQVTQDFSNSEIMLVAASFFKLKQYLECEMLCRKLYLWLGSEPEFMSLYGAVLRCQGKLNESNRIFELAISKGINDSALLNNYANLLIDLGQMDKAKQIYQSLKDRKPFNLQDIEANLLRLNNVEYKSNDDRSANNQQIFKIFYEEFSSEECIDKQEESLSSDSHIISDKNNNMFREHKRCELLELLAIARKNLDNDPKSVIRDCKMILNSKQKADQNETRFFIDARPEIYELLGEAQLSLNHYTNAETSFLTAIALGNRSKSNFSFLARIVDKTGQKSLSIKYNQISVQLHDI